MELDLYQDKWSRWHDKPVEDKMIPSSNNGWIYSAYAQMLGMELHRANLRGCFVNCIVKKYPVRINRSPAKEKPPLSKDEAIGMFVLNVGDYTEILLANNYLLDALYPKKSIWSIRGLKEISRALWNWRDRNYIWKNNLYTLYPILYRLPAADRNFIKRMIYKRNGIKVKGYYNPWEWFRFYVDGWFNAKFGSNSVKNYLYLQFHYLSLSKDRFDPLKSFTEYFGEDHPITKSLLKGVRI